MTRLLGVVSVARHSNYCPSSGACTHGDSLLMPCHSDDAVFYNVEDPKQPTNNETFTRNLIAAAEHVLDSPPTYINPACFLSTSTSTLPQRISPVFKWYSELTHIHWTATSEWIAAIKEYTGIMLDVAAR